MAFEKGAKTIDTSEKSVVLMAVEISRSDDSRFVPKPIAVKLELPNAKSKEERQNFKLNEDQDTVVDGGRLVYLTRMALKPGKYKMGDVTGLASAFPFVGTFVVPLLMDLEVKPNSITYVGRVTAKLRPRQGDEFRAGPVVPLIDQAATGLSGGTWDVTTENMSQRDLALYRAQFPALQSATIETSPLPPFDRAAAQRWWDGDTSPAVKPQTAPAAATK
jgi:hypothetical protein